MTARRLCLVALLAAIVPVAAQVPPEVTGLLVDGSDNLSWQAAAGAEDYNVYRGLLSSLPAGSGPRCHGDEIVPTSFASPADPAPGEAYVYLVTAETLAGEGTPGNESGGPERSTLGRCDRVMQAHAINRTGFGWNEWSRDRLAAIGVDAYIAEQLDPVTIDESTNTELNDALLFIDPPLNHIHLIGQQVVRGVYARRQLEHQVATFFNNHFNTDFNAPFGFFLGQFPACGQPPLPFCDEDYPNRALLEAAHTQDVDFKAHRDLAFNGTFREMAEQVSLSTAMIFYLNTDTNVLGTPNENYARELLELYTCGVDRCYDQQDIEEVARVFTGWNVCRKDLAVKDDPLAPCQLLYWNGTGEYVANFRVDQHDCGAKTIFHGQAEETIIPDTCGNPADGVSDVFLTLDAIVAHPETARYIAEKLLQRFATETPTTAMIDQLVTAWNDPSNPLGPGDMSQLLSALFDMADFSDPDRVNVKYKTPVEHMISAFRATRGNTDGITEVIDYMLQMVHIPYLNAIPTGWPESGSEWIGTNNLLERQNFGIDLTRRDPLIDTAFSAEIMGLLADNGVSTAPGNAAGIVDFFVDVLFAGALTPAERLKAIDYLDTDDNGVVSDYDEARIRETVGFMLGYPQFQEQ